MKALKALGRFLHVVGLPLRRNVLFFVAMYVLGVYCAWATTPASKSSYSNLWLELLLDLYVLCAVLALLPRRVRRWVRGVVAVVLYVVAVADVYCYSHFGSTISPTMLLLVGETNGREAGEFLHSMVSANVLLGKVGGVLLIALLHGVIGFITSHISGLSIPSGARPPVAFPKGEGSIMSSERKVTTPLSLWRGVGGEAVLLALLVWAAVASWPNKKAMHTLFTADTIGRVEHLLTRADRANLYVPVWRLAFSIQANRLAAQQITQLTHASTDLRVDSCDFRSPDIVLIIGESFGPHHSQQYGYRMPTTPRQLKREKSGLLTRYTDVVAPWNLTSFVFKNVFSMHVVGEQGEWCDRPLFPMLFRKAGYRVRFLTNQFLPKAKEEVYDFSGGFFLNHEELSAKMFDERNVRLYTYDEGLLDEYDRMASAHAQQPTLTIFHLMGQHVTYRQRYPRDRQHFDADDYKEWRTELNERKRRSVAEYDNAVLYNDSIVDQICRRFENREAVVIYMPDHGEECYEENRNFTCRRHSAAIDYKLAKYEFQIPFWIWCSRSYVKKNPEVYRQIVESKNRRLMTDALPHLLLYLGGIASPEYHAEYNVIADEYNEMRPRILKGTTDYDRLRPANEE